MDCSKDDIASCIMSDFHNQGYTCKKEVVIGNRRVDLECDHGFIEEKSNCRDLCSQRSHEQICDMKRAAESLHKPLVVHTPQDCYIPVTESAHEYIRKHNLPTCPFAKEYHCHYSG